MTIPPETERGYGNPLYEGALAVWQAREARTEPRLRRMEPDALDHHSGALALVLADVAAVAKLWRSKGWLSDLGITAIEAERMEK